MKKKTVVKSPTQQDQLKRETMAKFSNQQNQVRHQMRSELGKLPNRREWSRRLLTGRQRESGTVEIQIKIETATQGTPDGAREMLTERQEESGEAEIPREAERLLPTGLQMEPEKC